ncbi:ferredoxin reductase family protein [Agromyces sp. SYSU T00266]|uniref:ferredoxin reductase family protein n=1 Tax=Agromyces zhanjiangensis TaxID=3158562 RepID=UPI0033998486
MTGATRELPEPLAPTPVQLQRRHLGRVRLADLLEGVAWFSTVVVLALFLADGGASYFTNPLEVPTGLGIVAGLVGSNVVFIMLVLVARVPLLDRAFGADRTLAAHRWLGKPAIILLIAHALLLMWGYGLALGRDPIAQAAAMLTSMRDMPQAFAALAGFILVVVTSLAVVRRVVSHEFWYLVHLVTYAAVLLALPHQFSQGGLFAEGTWARWYWVAVSFGVLALILVFRVLIPLGRNLRHRLRVTEVVREAPGVASVTMTGRDLERLHGEGGQYSIWRFWSPGLRWEGHPYSLSAAPDGRSFRITVRDLGDDSRRVLSLEPGTRVYFEGPYGVFTTATRTSPDAVLMGAGIGITPIRALADSMVRAARSVTVILRANEDGQLYLRREFDAFREHPSVRVIEVVGPPATRTRTWLPDSMGDASLATLVPDLVDADVYVCGPAVWADLVIADARSAGLRRRQIHSERFAW